MSRRELRSCPTHGEHLHRHRYVIVKGKKYDRWVCVQCDNDTYRDRLRADKLKAVEYLGGECMDCGQTFQDFPSVFDFHHRDPSTKVRKPSAFFGGKWEKIVVELDKCDLLCSNCHRIRHATEGYPHQQ